MQPDPFGNLKDWGPVLEQIHGLAASGQLDDCQPGLVRVLAYRDNWRLREEILLRVGDIARPSDLLVRQVLRIISDENLYYEVRILAGEAMMTFMKNLQCPFLPETVADIHKALRDLLATPQPPLFEENLGKVSAVFSERFGIALRRQ